MREQETQAAIEDAEIKGLELQAQKEMLQQVSCKKRKGKYLESLYIFADVDFFIAIVSSRQGVVPRVEMIVGIEN